MAQFQTYRCDECGVTIDTDELALVSYEVVGVPPAAAQAGDVDVTDHPIPAKVRELLGQPVSRKDRCLDCRAFDYNEPLVDKHGKTVLDPKDFADRASFKAAAKAKHAAAKAARKAAKAQG